MQPVRYDGTPEDETLHETLKEAFDAGKEELERDEIESVRIRKLDRELVRQPMFPRMDLKQNRPRRR